jgi:hypothetical protein
MPIGIIVVLEMVDIQQNNGQSTAKPQAAIYFISEKEIEIPPVIDAGQCICKRELDDLGVQFRSFECRCELSGDNCTRPQVTSIKSDIPHWLLLKDQRHQGKVQ